MTFVLEKNEIKIFKFKLTEAASLLSYPNTHIRKYLWFVDLWIDTKKYVHS